MCPAFGQEVHAEFFYKVPINATTMWPVGPSWSLLQSAHQFDHNVPCGSMQDTLWKYSSKWPLGTLWKKPGFSFTILFTIYPTGCLSHSLRVLSKSNQQCDHNVPRRFFLMFSQWTLNVVGFHNKLSKKPLSIWFKTLWTHCWILYERTLNEWLRCMLDTL